MALPDRLRLLVGGGAFTNTYFLFDPCDPLIAFIQPPDAAQCPHQLPMTPRHSPASACHVLGVKGSPLSFPRMGHSPPPSPAPHTINPLVDRDGWAPPMTPYLRWRTPHPCKGLLSLMYNRGDARRSQQVKSAAPGRKWPQCSGGEFFSL